MLYAWILTLEKIKISPPHLRYAQKSVLFLFILLFICLYLNIGYPLSSYFILLTQV